jgi:branched-chain amino acid transport system substrate-binding protein
LSRPHRAGARDGVAFARLVPRAPSRVAALPDARRRPAPAVKPRIRTGKRAIVTRRSTGSIGKASNQPNDREEIPMFRKSRLVVVAQAFIATLALFVAGGTGAQAAEPIKIGFGMALTGGLAGNGKAALLGFQIWEKDINAHGGILGRPVKLIYYDDQSNPSTVPGIYTKLLDVDKVDLVFSGYATNQVAPAMPILMQRGLVVMSMFALSLNEQFHYDRYFGIMPTGPNGKVEFAKGFFDLAAAQKPKPTTVAIAYADAEFAKAAAEGARENAKRVGFKVVYDKSYPPKTVDFTPIMRAIQAANPDVVFVGSYPPDSAGMVRAANEVGLKTKMFGGGMVGLQFAVFKGQLGPMLNGIVNYDFYVDEPTLDFPGVKAFIERYRPLAVKEGVDPLGFYLPPYAYAEGQILADAANAVGSLDQKKMAEYIHSHTFDTVVGKIKFEPGGEWATPRVLEIQFQNVEGHDVEQFKKAGKEPVVYPPELVSGKLQYPYSSVKR